jgi:hypothetical protein
MVGKCGDGMFGCVPGTNRGSCTWYRNFILYQVHDFEPGSNRHNRARLKTTISSQTPRPRGIPGSKSHPNPPAAKNPTLPNEYKNSPRCEHSHSSASLPHHFSNKSSYSPETEAPHHRGSQPIQDSWYPVYRSAPGSRVL